MTQDAGEATQVRVCEYRRCGAPLPPAVGRGSRARFCQDGKTWGRRALSCRDAEAVLADAESLRESDTRLDDTAVTALAGQIDRVLAPAAGLVDVLTTLRQQLSATTAAALAERDDALAEAEEHRRQRGLAEAGAAQARQAAEDAGHRAAAAEKERKTAERERDEDRALRVAALEEQQRAEGRLAAVRDELARVAERAEAAASLAGERATVIAGLTADLAAVRVALDEERGRSQAATGRAEAAESRAAATAERLDAVREELANAAAAHQAAQESARTSARAETDRLRTGFDERLGELQASHERTVRAMHETSTTLGAELRTCAARADTAERTLARVLATLIALRENHELELPGDVRQLLEPEHDDRG